MTPALSPEDLALLARLEESMWVESTRFDRAYMEGALAPDFLEFGRSGGAHTREAVMDATRRVIDVLLPLRELAIRPLDANTAQVTYVSESADGRVLARRSSIWSRTARGWRLRFHQGTPMPAGTAC